MSSNTNKSENSLPYSLPEVRTKEEKVQYVKFYDTTYNIESFSRPVAGAASSNSTTGWGDLANW